MSVSQTKIIIFFFFVAIVYLVYFIPSVKNTPNEAYTQNSIDDSKLNPIGVVAAESYFNNMIANPFSLNNSVAKKLADIIIGNDSTTDIKEGFFGGYVYPMDYYYYWPFFYSGCNEDVFGNIKCLPQSAHPFW